MTTLPRRRRLIAGAVGVAGVLLATACGYEPTPVPTAPETLSLIHI